MKDIFKNIGNILNPQYKVGPLNAIWLNKGLVTKSGKLYHIAPGDFVTVENGALIDSTEDPTHIITSCSGKPDNTELFFVCADIKTYQLQRVDL